MKNSLLIAAATLLLSVPSLAQKPTSMLHLWPGEVPGSTAPKADPVVDTKVEKGTIRYNAVTDPTLELHAPIAPVSDAAFIVCPGGAYQVLAYNKEGTEIAQWLARQGFVAYTLAYRVPNQQAGALQDVQRAIRLVRERHNVSKVGVIGFSAGASLSARAATRFAEQTYEPVDAADTLSARPDFAMLIYPAYLDLGENNTLTPELTVTKETSPMFIFGTEDDYYSRTGSLVMADALKDKGVPVELHYLARGGHGYGMRYGVGLIWPGLAQQWLKGIVPPLQR